MVNGALVQGRIARKAVGRDPLRIGRWPCCKHCKEGRGLYPFGGRGLRRGIAEIPRRRECASLSYNLASALSRSHTDPPADEATLAATRSKDRTFASRTTPAVSHGALGCCGSARCHADCGRQDSAKLRSLESPSTSRLSAIRQTLPGHKMLHNIPPCHLGGTPRPVRQTW